MEFTWGHEQPRIWIRRLVLYRQLEPLEVIRDVSLSTGMNIVWGIEQELEAESGGGEQDIEPGHGLGKTTFCRMIRYGLGESNYGQTHAEAEISSTFPMGCVGLEVVIHGRVWAVLRPFAKRRSSHARPDAAVEELIAELPGRSSFDEYRAHLAAAGLAGIPRDPVLSGDAAIQWDHILAMCSRDQEARFGSLWGWRDPRSQSGTPAFRQPKRDALACVRVVLGVLPELEIQLRRQLDELESDLQRINRNLEEKRREPDYWLPRLRRRLRDEFGIADAMTAPLDRSDMFCLWELVQRRIREVQAERAETAAELAGLERQIALASATLAEPAEHRREIEAATTVGGVRSDTLITEIEAIKVLRRQIDDVVPAGFCRYGQIAFAECTHVELAKADLDARHRELRESSLPTISQQEQASAELRERARRLREAEQRARARLDSLIEQRDSLREQVREADRFVRDIRSILDEINRWDAVRSGTADDPEMSRLISDRDRTVTSLDEGAKQLDEALVEQNRRLTEVQETYEMLVGRVLSRRFRGHVELSSDGLTFRVFRGHKLSGEAFDTLAILLADLAVLVLAAMDKAHHPGILIHDSPREADLGAAVYRRFLGTVAELSSGNSDSVAPFQYIITTTTPPPADQTGTGPPVRLRLGGSEGPLFRQEFDDGDQGDSVLPFGESIE